jgi:hypothetical protein
MLYDFQRARWEMFFKALEEGRTITSPEWFKWEDNWSRSKSVTTVPKEDPVSVAEEIFCKYFNAD